MVWEGLSHGLKINLRDIYPRSNRGTPRGFHEPLGGLRRVEGISRGVRSVQWTTFRRDPRTRHDEPGGTPRPMELLLQSGRKWRRSLVSEDEYWIKYIHLGSIVGLVKAQEIRITIIVNITSSFYVPLSFFHSM